MSFTYTTPTGLTGVPASLSIPLTWGPSSVISGGPSLLLHMDGVNGSTTFTDSSSNALVVTAHPGAALSTVQEKFGPSSGLFSGGYVSTPIAAGGVLDLGTGDFTIEGWMYAGVQGGTQGILFYLGNGTASPIYMYFQSSTNSLTGSVFGTIASAVNAITQNTWTHVAIVGLGSTATLYINGVSSGTASMTGRASFGGGAYALLLGDQLPAGITPYSGYIDEFRVMQQAMYTTNFTPAPAPFPGSAPTGYDVYRNGISIAQYVGLPGYTDNVPGVGLYTYNVAGSDGMSTDLSGLSAPFTIGIGQIGGIQAKFVPALDFKAIMVANPGSINPRIYPPLDDNTVRVKP